MADPFLPKKHTGTHAIDAADGGPGAPASSETPSGVDEIVPADPGPGGPGSLPPEELTDEERARRQKEFEERMEREREHPHLFRTPEPRHHD